MNPADDKGEITCSVWCLFVVCRLSAQTWCIIWIFAFLPKVPGGRGMCSSNLSLRFHLFSSFFTRKQGWRWKHRLNKLLLRILQALQRLLRRLGENGFLPQFCTDENKHFFCQRRQKIENECELAMPYASACKEWSLSLRINEKSVKFTPTRRSASIALS